MDVVTKIVFGIHGIIWGVGLILIIYLIFRRIRIKKEEDFEERDN
ncbi:hypothetical protein [Crocinitomix algicola]|nr:hypothetical protein [Crocinitomix algicola]